MNGAAKQKRKIAILGGGMGALVTAYELSGLPHAREDLAITVYNLGHRLGGKGASGRNLAAHDRIEEHGLHILGGSYTNTFSILNAVYAELDRPPGAPFRSARDAFQAHSYFVLKEGRDGQWPIRFPETSDFPGEAVEPPSAWGFVKLLLGSLEQLFLVELRSLTERALGIDEGGLSGALTSVRTYFRDKLPDLGDLLGGPNDQAPNFGRTIVEAAKDLADTIGLAAELSYLHVAKELAGTLPDHAHSDHHTLHDGIASYLREFRRSLHGKMRGEVAHDDVLRHIWILADLAIAAVIGMIADGLILPPQRWFAIDDLEIGDWLMKYGASKEAAESVVVRVFREFLFSEQDGVGAGTTLHAALHLVFGYKGAFSYKMRAGMGDVVFAPFYEVLARRGVRFEFFRRVDRLELSADKRVVDKIHIGVQATLTGPAYHPLCDVKGLPSWPSEPLYDQLVEGDALRAQGVNLEDFWTRWQDPAPPIVLERGADFDDVVLGISLGAFPFIARELMDCSAPFREMVEHVSTVQTRAFQLWLAPTLAELGWTEPSPILGTFPAAYDTWADMTQLEPAESWPRGRVGHIAYFTDQLGDDEPVPPASDHDYPARQNERVKASALAWLETNTRPLWPLATTPADPEALRWSLLVDDQERSGVARFDSQFWHAPVNPSERYVQSAPGTTKYRLREHQSGFENLVMAGDYVLTAWSSGFLEAATMSGMQAARAVASHPRPIVGHWLPDVPGAYVRSVESGRSLHPRQPRYIPQLANFVPIQPYLLSGTTMFGFVVPADYDRLCDLCDRYLNHGGGTVYRPMGPFVAFICADIEHIASREPPSWTPERDFGFWVPVLAGRIERGLFVAERVAFFIPYIWVDSALAVTVGREVQGFPKGMGELSLPAGPYEPARFAVKGPAVLRYGAERTDASRWKMRPIVAAERTNGGVLGDLEAIWTGLTEMARALGELLIGVMAGAPLPVPSLELVRSTLEDASLGVVPLVFLKELPDIANGSRAAYQAVVEAPCQVKGDLAGAGLLEGDYDLVLHAYDSCHVADVLGLPAASTSADGVIRVRSAFQFWVRFDFALGEGTVIWQG